MPWLVMKPLVSPPGRWLVPEIATVTGAENVAASKFTSYGSLVGSVACPVPPGKLVFCAIVVVGPGAPSGLGVWIVTVALVTEQALAASLRTRAVSSSLSPLRRTIVSPDATWSNETLIPLELQPAGSSWALAAGANAPSPGRREGGGDRAGRASLAHLDLGLGRGQVGVARRVRGDHREPVPALLEPAVGLRRAAGPQRLSETALEARLLVGGEGDLDSSPFTLTLVTRVSGARTSRGSSWTSGSGSPPGPGSSRAGHVQRAASRRRLDVAEGVAGPHLERVGAIGKAGER